MGHLCRKVRGEPLRRGAPARLGAGDRRPFRDGAIVKPGPVALHDRSASVRGGAGACAGGSCQRAERPGARPTNLGRAARLHGEAAISQSEVDDLNANVRSTAAAVAAAKADVRARDLDVEFTQVRAPIGGRVSDRRVDAGNQVTAGEGGAGTLLTTINALDPIYFTFDGSEALFLKAKRARRAGARSSPVEIRLQDEASYRWKGQLDFTDNGLDPRSGTIRPCDIAQPRSVPDARHVRQHAAGQRGTERALLVPDAAIADRSGAQDVLVVLRTMCRGAAGDARPLVDGLRVIPSGLDPGERVIISGTQIACPVRRSGCVRDGLRRSRRRRAAPSSAPKPTLATHGGPTRHAPFALLHHAADLRRGHRDR